MGFISYLPSEFLSPTQSLVDFSGCHVNNITLTISSKFHPNFELGGFSIGYVIATSEPADTQVSPFSPTRTTFELSGFSIGYVIATSEPADSQALSFIPVRTISLSSYDNFELGGFSIGYVIATSELADSRSYLLVQ